MAENEMNGAVEPDKQKDAHHDTLKYSLLGPSLMKSGQDAVDQQKVSTLFHSPSHYDSRLTSARFQRSSTKHPKAPSSSRTKPSATRTSPYELSTS